MKYLKLYEEFEILDHDKFYEWVKIKISSKINRNLINDIKDMSLEYLDEGLCLLINIYCNDVYFCGIFFSHIKNVEEFYLNNLRSLDDDVVILDDDVVIFYDVLKITSQDFTYEIILDKPQGVNLQYYKSEDECMQKTKELTHRVVEAYPKENIKC